MGTITSIACRTTGQSYQRTALTCTTLVAGYGISLDRKGGHPRRQLNIVDREQLDRLGIEHEPGLVGENLVLEGVGIGGCPPGTRLRLGPAIVEVTGARAPCNKLASSNPAWPADEPVGVMARVIEGGLIGIGDGAEIIDSEPGSGMASAP
jgi:MOSC domain-containing protein YiiM